MARIEVCRFRSPYGEVLVTKQGFINEYGAIIPPENFRIIECLYNDQKHIFLFRKDAIGGIYEYSFLKEYSEEFILLKKVLDIQTDVVEVFRIKSWSGFDSYRPGYGFHYVTKDDVHFRCLLSESGPESFSLKDKKNKHDLFYFSNCTHDDFILELIEHFEIDENDWESDERIKKFYAEAKARNESNEKFIKTSFLIPLMIVVGLAVFGCGIYLLYVIYEVITM
jgi:hypothetical protein